MAPYLKGALFLPVSVAPPSECSNTHLKGFCETLHDWSARFLTLPKFKVVLCSTLLRGRSHITINAPTPAHAGV